AKRIGGDDDGNATNRSAVKKSAGDSQCPGGLAGSRARDREVIPLVRAEVVIECFLLPGSEICHNGLASFSEVAGGAQSGSVNHVCCPAFAVRVLMVRVPA